MSDLSVLILKAPTAPRDCPDSGRGKTWERMKVDIPAAMRKYAYFTPQSPVFTGDFGVIPLVCRDHAAETDTMEYLITTDGGLNWHWEQSTPK